MQRSPEDRSAPTLDPEQYASRIQFYVDTVPPLLLEYLAKEEWSTCMDLGCGDGALLAALNNRGVFEGKTVYPVDNSQGRIDLVREISQHFECIVADAADTTVPDGSIDVMISTQVIEHVLNDQDMAKEMFRVLRPGGLLYLSTVFKTWYGWYYYRCNGKWTIDPTHLREYTAENQLLDLFRPAEFQLLENKKTLDGRPIVDSVLRRFGASRQVYAHRALRRLRAIRLPIPGYYQWELVYRKK